MAFSKTTELQRVRYWQGQKLRSRDLRDQFDMAAQLRWWHNRALHNTYGVSFGFGITLVFDAEKEAVKVDPGLAYDVFGREIVLQRARKIDAPPLQNGEIATLLIRYKDTAGFPQKPAAVETCVETADSSFQEQPELQWVNSDRADVKQGVAVARLQKRNNLLSLDPDFRPSFARALARPRLASGATIPGNTPWKVWTPSGVKERGYEVVIDTSTAGFTQTPCYFAWLQGKKTLWSQTQSNFFPAFFAHLAQSSIKSFVFRLWMPVLNLSTEGKANKDFETEFLRFARNQELFVCWLGIQPASDHDQ